MSIEDVVDRRIQAGEKWATLAGVPFRVLRLRYGLSKSVVLRTVEGKAYRLAPLGQRVLPAAALQYVHDVLIEETTYHVNVTPADGTLAKQLQGEPVNVGLGAPAMLRAVGEDGERYALKRTPALDGKPIVGPKEKPDGLSTALMEEVARIAEQRGVDVETALDYVIRQGVSRIKTRSKFDSKSKRNK